MVPAGDDGLRWNCGRGRRGLVEDAGSWRGDVVSVTEGELGFGVGAEGVERHG